jgi:flagellar biosynthetic protein FliQ
VPQEAASGWPCRGRWRTGRQAASGTRLGLVLGEGLEVNLEQAIDMGREAVMMILVISGPILILGLLVGLVVSLFQAVTQLHEQTLVFVPKIIAMAVAAVVLMPWMAKRMIEYSAELFGNWR